MIVQTPPKPEGAQQCPACGSDPEEARLEVDDNPDNPLHHQINCSDKRNCSLSGPIDLHENKAVEKWNKIKID